MRKNKISTIFSVENVPFYDQNTLENWQEKGLLSEDEATIWNRKACGISCIKMVAEAFGKEVVSIGQLIREAVNIGAYKDGVGWIHFKIAEFASKKFNLKASAERNISVDSIIKIVEDGCLIIASVGFGFYRGNSGHLVVVLGYEMKESSLSGFYVHHPSTKRELCEIKKLIPIEKFVSSFSGNIIVLNKSA